MTSPNRPTLAARLLQPLFNALSVETRLWLARDVSVPKNAAWRAAKERWGEDGNCVIDGNVLRVGVGTGAAFVEHGRGRTWREAFDDADQAGTEILHAEVP